MKSKEEIITTINEYIAQISFSKLSDPKKEAIINLWKDAREVIEKKELDPVQLYLTLSFPQFQTALIASQPELMFKGNGEFTIKNGGISGPLKLLDIESVINPGDRNKQYLAYLKYKKKYL